MVLLFSNPGGQGEGSGRKGQGKKIIYVPNK